MSPSLINKGEKMKRMDGRKPDEMRKVKVKMGYLKYALGSCLIEFGNTRVLCSASIDDGVPRFLKGQGKGWLTSEYGMLPASCNSRISRESSKGKISGRTSEIQRLIGRSLRAVVDLEKLGERTIWIDADVIQGDGGTRTASITGAYLALKQAVGKLIKQKVLTEDPIIDNISAISVGVIGGVPFLDLCYVEDSSADTDMNVVMTGKGKFIEVQGTAEGAPFTEKELSQLLVLAKKGNKELTKLQDKY